MPVALFELDEDGIGRLRYIQPGVDQQLLCLDPIHLPLANCDYKISPGPDSSYGVLTDAGPGIWGKQFLGRYFRSRKKRVPENQIEWLLAAAVNGAGAVGFAPRGESSRPAPLFKVCDLTTSVLSGIAQFDVHSDQRIAPDIERILSSGAALGGARPKTIILHEGREYIAKFSRADDQFDVPAVEFATMRLAYMAGINVPEIELVEFSGGSVYLIERFDRTDVGQHIHCISAQSLLAPDQLSFDRSDYRTSFSYGAIAEALQKSDGRTKANHEIFRRMVFNILVGNIDDHLRNQSVFVTEANSFALTPAYDVVPHLEAYSRPQSIGVGNEGPASTRSNVLSQSHRFMLSGEEAGNIIDEVRGVVSRWRDVFREAGIKQSEIRLLAECFGAMQVS